MDCLQDYVSITAGFITFTFSVRILKWFVRGEHIRDSFFRVLLLAALAHEYQKNLYLIIEVAS